jgi:hypothetical protein
MESLRYPSGLTWSFMEWTGGDKLWSAEVPVDRVPDDWGKTLDCSEKV